MYTVDWNAPSFFQFTFPLKDLSFTVKIMAGKRLFIGNGQAVREKNRWDPILLEHIQV